MLLKNVCSTNTIQIIFPFSVLTSATTSIRENKRRAKFVITRTINVRKYVQGQSRSAKFAEFRDLLIRTRIVFVIVSVHQFLHICCGHCRFGRDGGDERSDRFRMMWRVNMHLVIPRTPRGDNVFDMRQIAPRCATNIPFRPKRQYRNRPIA